MTATEPATIHNTFVIERNFPHRLSRVFSFFSQPALKRRWYTEREQEILDFHMDFRMGGIERFRYRFKQGHPIAGSEIANESTYQVIEDDKRIVVTSRMSLNGKPILVMLATFEFLPAANGTDLILTHQGAYTDWPDGVKMIEMGWKTLFDRLRIEIERFQKEQAE